MLDPAPASYRSKSGKEYLIYKIHGIVREIMDKNSWTTFHNEYLEDWLKTYEIDRAEAMADEKHEDGKNAERPEQGEDANILYERVRGEDDAEINAKEQLEAVRNQYQGTDKWLKAPNGKKSNLSEKQWLQVRTPNFKKWFGNWEALAIKERLTNGDMVTVQDEGNELIKGQEHIWRKLITDYSNNKQGTPKQLLEFLRPLIPETITNVNIGDIGFTKNSIRNSLHHNNGKANAIVLPYIKELLESAEYVGSRNIEANRTSYVLAKPLSYKGQRFIMLMVVNEDAQGKKYYDHEFTTIKKIDDLPAVLRKSKSTENGQNHQSLLSILAEDVWFNNVSKVVDENGEPLVVPSLPLGKS